MWLERKNGSVSKRFEAIRNDLQNLQSDVRGLAGDLGEAAASRAGRAIRPAAKTLDHLTTRLDGASNGLVHMNSDEVRQIATIVLAAGAGAVVAGLMARR
jgi:hypothetical protein